MSASPLASNAVAIFKVPGEYSIDSLGNKVASSTEVSVKLFLRGDGRAQEQKSAGTDNTVRVTGRCVEPLRLPDGILPGAVAQCTISTPTASLSGELKLDPSIPGAYRVEEIIGQKINGEFRQLTTYGGVA